MEILIKGSEKFSSLVSVVMPVHNGEQFLREAIESVLNQTYKNFEFLIIENCSTDSSVEIIKSYNDPRVRIIIEKDCGQVQAYNRGFKEAKGEYIFIHDHDDLSHHQRFEKQLEYVIGNKIDICGSYFSLINHKDEKIGHIEMPTTHFNIVNELLYKNSTIFNSSVCIKNIIFNELGYFDIAFYPSADYDFYLKGIAKFIYGNIPEYLYSWRQHPKQISNVFMKNCTQKTIQISLNNKTHFPTGMKNTYTGFVYYYNNKLLLALGWFLKTIFTDKFSKKLFRYFLIIILCGIPLKIFRKFNLVNSKFFISSKRKIDILSKYFIQYDPI